MYNNQRTRRWCLRALGGAVGGAAMLGSASADEHVQEIEVELTGEAHGIKTEASGLAAFRPDFEAGEVNYRLDVRNICNVTMAHIHRGGPDEDGSIVVWLYPEEGMEPELVEGRFTGTLAEGTFSADDFVGPWEDLTLDEAHAQVEERGGYVNVHTEEHSGGEIRGQIEPTDVPEEEKADEEPPEEEEEEEEPNDLPFELGEINVGEEVPPDEEYITLHNFSNEGYHVAGFTLQDLPEEGVVDTHDDVSPFRFPDGFMLNQDTSVRIITGGDPADNTDEVLHWGAETQIWDPEGDTVIIRNVTGDIVFRESYPDQTMAPSIAHRLGFSRSGPPMTPRFGRRWF